MRLQIAVVLLLCSSAVALDYWQTLAHGLNARVGYSKSRKTGSTKVAMPSKFTGGCYFGRFSTPFDGREYYAGAGISPAGQLQTLVICKDTDNHDHVYFVSLDNIGSDPTIVPLSVSSYQSYLSYMPKGSPVFGCDNNIAVLNKTTFEMVTYKGHFPVEVFSYSNVKPQQFVWSGGYGGGDWYAAAADIVGDDKINLKSYVGDSDTTVMWAADGKKMYNNHFIGGGDSGLQTWVLPFHSRQTPANLNRMCADTRPWTFAAATNGHYYAHCTDGRSQDLHGFTEAGEKLWGPPKGIPAFRGDWLQLSDDESAVLTGNAEVAFSINSRTGDLMHNFNLTHLSGGGRCHDVASPWGARSPIVLAQSTKLAFLCEKEKMWSIYQLDWTVSQESQPEIEPIPISHSPQQVLWDEANNAYVFYAKDQAVYFEVIRLSSK